MYNILCLCCTSNLFGLAVLTVYLGSLFLGPGGICSVISSRFLERSPKNIMKTSML